MQRINFQLSRVSILFAISFALPTTAQAALLLINNPSFETPVTANATFTGAQATGPSGWTVYNTGATNNLRYFGVWNPATTNSFISGAPHGANVGVVFLENTTNIAEAGLQQVLSSTLQLSTQYTLTVEVGNFSDFDITPFDFTGFPGYRIDLYAGSTLLASDNNTLSPGEGVFATSTFTYTTGASHANVGQALGIRLVNLNGAGTEVNFDNVRLDATAVPEPSTSVLGGILMIWALFKRHRTTRNY
jgi:hapalindole H/12-epi-hapalindole U/12-epi-fischerindole U synthase